MARRITRRGFTGQFGAGRLTASVQATGGRSTGESAGSPAPIATGLGGTGQAPTEVAVTSEQLTQALQAPQPSQAQAVQAQAQQQATRESQLKQVSQRGSMIQTEVPIGTRSVIQGSGLGGTDFRRSGGIPLPEERMQRESFTQAFRPAISSERVNINQTGLQILPKGPIATELENVRIPLFTIIPSVQAAPTTESTQDIIGMGTSIESIERRKAGLETVPPTPDVKTFNKSFYTTLKETPISPYTKEQATQFLKPILSKTFKYILEPFTLKETSEQIKTRREATEKSAAFTAGLIGEGVTLTKTDVGLAALTGGTGFVIKKVSTPIAGKVIKLLPEFLKKYAPKTIEILLGTIATTPYAIERAAAYKQAQTPEEKGAVIGEPIKIGLLASAEYEAFKGGLKFLKGKLGIETPQPKVSPTKAKAEDIFRGGTGTTEPSQPSIKETVLGTPKDIARELIKAPESTAREIYKSVLSSSEKKKVVVAIKSQTKTKENAFEIYKKIGALTIGAVAGYELTKEKDERKNLLGAIALTALSSRKGYGKELFEKPFIETKFGYTPQAPEQSKAVLDLLNKQSSFYYASTQPINTGFLKPESYVTYSLDYAKSLKKPFIYEVEKPRNFLQTIPVGNKFVKYHLISKEPVKIIKELKTFKTKELALRKSSELISRKPNELIPRTFKELIPKKFNSLIPKRLSFLEPRQTRLLEPKKPQPLEPFELRVPQIREPTRELVPRLRQELVPKPVTDLVSKQLRLPLQEPDVNKLFEFPKLPIIPPRLSLSGGFGGFSQARAGARSYAPSVEAIVRNIAGKQQGKGMASGFELRPVSKSKMTSGLGLASQLALGLPTKQGQLGKMLAGVGGRVGRKLKRFGLGSPKREKRSKRNKNLLFGG